MKRALLLAFIPSLALADFITGDSTPAMPAAKSDVATCTGNVLKCAWTYNRQRQCALDDRTDLLALESLMATIEADGAGTMPTKSGCAAGTLALPALFTGADCVNRSSCLDAYTANSLLLAAKESTVHLRDLFRRISALNSGTVATPAVVGTATDFVRSGCTTPGGLPLAAAKTANVTACPGSLGTCMDKDAFNALRSAWPDVCSHVIALRDRVAAREVLAQPVAIAPSTATVFLSTSTTFSANQSVTWSITEGSCGTIVAGVYTAPGSPATCHVVATSVANPSKSATATVTVTATSGDYLAACSALDKGTGTITTGSLSNPAYLGSATDPQFGTSITRTSGTWGSPLPTTWQVAPETSLNGKVWRSLSGGPVSPQDDSWNADESLLVCKWCVDGGYLFMDGTTYHPLFHRGWPTAGGEVRWDPSDATRMIYVDGSGQVGYWYPRTNSKTARVAAPGGMTSANVMGGNGHPSWDGRYIAVSGVSGGKASIFVADLLAGTRVLPVTAIDSYSLDTATVDGGSISPSGAYVEVIDTNWKRAFVSVATNTTLRAASEVGYHSDVQQTAAGVDVSYALNTNQNMIRFDTGASTSLLSGAGSDWHAGSANYLMKGWGFMDFELTGSGWAAGEIVAVELAASPKLRRLVHHRATGGSSGNYGRTPFAVPSPSGKRVFFGSDWGNSAGHIFGYVVDLRPVCGP